MAAHSLAYLTDTMDIGQPSTEAANSVGIQRWPRRVCAIMDNLTPSVFVGVLDLDGRLRYANQAALNTKALEAQEVIGKRIEDTPWWPALTAGHSRLRQAIGDAIAGRASRFDVTTTDANGRPLMLDFFVQPVLGTNCEEGYLVASACNVTERRRVARLLCATQAAVDRSHEAVLQVTADGEIRYANDAACHLLGYERKDLLSIRASALDSDLRMADWPSWWSDLKMRRNLECSGFARHQGGRRIPVVVLASYIEHDDWECAYVHLVDLSERAASEERIRRAADHDAATGLPNRRRLCEIIDQRLQATVDSRPNLDLLVIGIERFKLINDSLGHLGGDQVLCEVARRLTQCAGEAALVGRVTADEFAIALFNESPTVALTADTTGRVLAALSSPIRSGDEDVYVSCAIGVARHPGAGETAEELISNAGIAIREGTRRDGGRVQHFTPLNRTRDRERLRLEADLHRAADRGDFALVYQPRIETRLGKIIGVEALLRWPRPDGGSISPARFIPIAEETGLILPIGAWALREAIAQAKIWQERGGSATRVSVNLSARQFRQPDLADSIARILEQTGLEPQRLELELTESMLISDVEQALHTMHALKDLGLRLSLDDFGTGYSSLSYLSRFPIDTLKIDQAFVQKMDVDATSLAIVDAVIGIAHRLGLSVTAEGVETERQCSLLRERGCEEIQGFLIARPMPIPQLQPLLDEQGCLLPGSIVP